MTDARVAAERARRVSRFWPVVSGLTALVLVAAAGLLIAAREANLDVDAEWMAEVVEHRSPYWEVPSRLMDFLGGGWVGVVVVPVGTVALLLVRRRVVAALYYAIAAAASAGLVQLVKNVIGRARPLDIMVTTDFGSFPSGHVANAATIAVTLGIVFKRASVWLAGIVYVVLMLLSRTYLGAHWLTDTLGGLLLGTAVAVIVWAPLANRLRLERQRLRR